MKKIFIALTFILTLSCLHSGIFTKVLECNNTINLEAVESVKDGKTFLTVSGLCADSSMSVKEICLNQIDNVICIEVKVSALHSKKESGRFNYSIEIPEGCTSVVYGLDWFELWNIDSPFRTGVLVKGAKIPSGTTLVTRGSQFSEERYEFTTEKSGVVKYYMTEYCNKCDSYPDGIVYNETRKPGKFEYNPDDGSMLKNGQYIGHLVFIPAEDCYVFYTDGTFYGPLSLKKDDDSSEDVSAGYKDTYIEENSIIKLGYWGYSSFRFVLHDGNKLCHVVDYMYKTNRKVYLNDDPPEYLKNLEE
ncbi:hypothetical protein [Treponema sp.]|uniref:hypothetical protein n=1 Tax=Treponema sp. TaxID=166 RepID=UPI00388ECBAF